MDAVKFLKFKNELCLESIEAGCRYCSLYEGDRNHGSCLMENCNDARTQEIVDIVTKWAKEHSLHKEELE